MANVAQGSTKHELMSEHQTKEKDCHGELIVDGIESGQRSRYQRLAISSQLCLRLGVHLPPFTSCANCPGNGGKWNTTTRHVNYQLISCLTCFCLDKLS